MNEKTGKEMGRHPAMKDVITIFKDPGTETRIEGFAYVWEILSEDEDFYTLLISFMGDKTERKVPRKYRKKAPE